MLCAWWMYGEPVILKLTDEHKVAVLWHLHGNQSTKPSHIIPLVDIVDGKVIVLLKRMPLLHFLDLDALGGNVGALAVQFMEGGIPATIFCHSSQSQTRQHCGPTGSQVEGSGPCHH